MSDAKKKKRLEMLKERDKKSKAMVLAPVKTLEEVGYPPYYS